MAAKRGQPKKRGPKQGVKHQPGRGHDRKSAVAKKKRFAKKAVEKRKRAEEDAKKAWAEYDARPEEIQRLLGSAGYPRAARPKDD